MDFQPYKIESWDYEMKLQDWLDGWKEAEEDYVVKKNDKTKSTDDFINDITDVLIGADEDFIEMVANMVLYRGITYIGDSLWEEE